MEMNRDKDLIKNQTQLLIINLTIKIRESEIISNSSNVELESHKF